MTTFPNIQKSKRSFLIKEATTESFYLLEVTSAIDAKNKNKKIHNNSPNTTFKTNVSNLIFIRM